MGIGTAIQTLLAAAGAGFGEESEHVRGPEGTTLLAAGFDNVQVFVRQVGFVDVDLEPSDTTP